MGYTPPVRYAPTRSRTLADALGLGHALLASPPSERAPALTASVVEGPAVVLGAHQRAGRVLDLAACARAGVAVHRRATAGTPTYVDGRAVVWTLWLPRVAALAPDATWRTLLNRNVRGFLHGLTRAGAPAHYFGREWIAVRHRPAAVLGFEVASDGAVLLEVVAGYDAPVALPPALATPLERATDRWRGKDPLALAEVARECDPDALAARVIESHAARWGTALEPLASPWVPAPRAPVEDAREPVPAELSLAEPVRCAVGWIDAAATEAPAPRVWLGGDVLAPRGVLDALGARIAAGGEAVAEVEGPLEGARVEDLWRAGESALRAARRG
jgi:hypothetical protein